MSASQVEATADRLPEQIDASFAPRPRDSVVSRRLDDEVIIVGGRSGRIHVLNSTAGLLSECFDGSASIEELAAELSEAFGAPLEQVRTDTLETARELGGLGLRDGVSPPAPKTAPPAGQAQSRRFDP